MKCKTLKDQSQKSINVSIKQRIRVFRKLKESHLLYMGNFSGTKFTALNQPHLRIFFSVF